MSIPQAHLCPRPHKTGVLGYIDVCQKNECSLVSLYV